MSLHLPRPSGIRNGGLLLVLVALAAIMALVDRPPAPTDGPRLPWVAQHLPPPAGITAAPPVTSTPAGGGQVVAVATEGARPAAGRTHPNRTHPRPARPGSSRRSGGGGATRPVGGGGSGGSGPSLPPVAAPLPTAAPAVTVRVPPVKLRVRTPRVLGRDLPDAEVETPAATVTLPALG
jgi:hypothetical protein